MADDVSGTVLRGLLIHDPRIKTATLDSSESTYTQADPRPGVPEDQNTPRSDMTFESSGLQSASKELRFRIGRGGYPGVDARGAGGLWKYEADTDWYGQDVYNAITGRDWIEYLDNSVSTDNLDGPHVLRLADSSVIAAYHYYTVANGSRIRIKTMTPGGSWTTAAHVSPNQTVMSSSDFNPCLLVLPSKRIQLYYWIKDTIAAVATVQMQYSDDGGTTWTLGSTACLQTSIDISATSSGFSLGRIRVARSDSQVLLVAELDSNDGGTTLSEVLTQWASDDEGVTFSEVETWVPDVNNGSQPCVLAGLDGGFVIIIALLGATGSAMYRLPSAFEKLTTAGTTTMGGLTVGSEVIDVFRDEDLALYMFWFNTTDAIQLVRSIDDGLTWVHLDDDSSNAAAFWHLDDANTMLSTREFTSTAVEGRAVVLCKFTTATGSKDDESLLCLYGGGSSTVTLPSSALFRLDANQLAFNRTWVDIEKPGDTADWTRTGGGTDTLTSGGLNIATTGGQTLIYGDTGGNIGTTSVDDQVVILAELDVQSGGTLATDRLSIFVQLADGANDYSISIRFISSAFRVYDNHAGAAVGSDVSLTLTDSTQLLIAVKSGGISVFYRATGTASDNARAWSAGPSGALTSDTGSPAANSSIAWGHRVAAAGETNWAMFLWAVMLPAAQDLGAGFTNPADLFTRPLSRAPIGVDDAVRLAAVDGPGLEAQTWNIDTRYGYAIENLDITLAPSPSRRWRSLTNLEQDIVWDLQGLAADTRYGSTTLGLYLGAINWQTGSLWGKANGGSWVKLIDLDASTGMTGLAYTRTGDTVGPNTGSTVNAAQFLQYDEYAGGSFSLSGSIVRRIVRHTEGSFTNDTTRRPTLFLEDVEDGDPVSGTGAIWSPRLLAILHNVSDYRYLRLRIDGQDTVGDYFEIGACVLGPLALFGQEYSWGRVLSTEAQVEVQTARDGSRYSRQLGVPRRTVSFSWAEGVDTTQVYSSTGTNAVPNYITGTPGAEAIGTPYDTPMLLSGVLEQISGPNVPLVYCPAIARGTPNTVQYTARQSAIYGRLVSPVRLEAVVGEEEQSEVMRVLNIEIDEEV